MEKRLKFFADAGKVSDLVAKSNEIEPVDFKSVTRKTGLTDNAVPK